MKKILIIVLVVVCFAFFGCISLTISMKKSLAKIQNAEIDMNKVEDGNYNGHSELGPVIVDVAVEVENHKIKKIELLRHDCGLGHPADEIVNTMVEKNTFDVDVISGATISSEIIKNAVNNALQ
ncbi:MAG: FMN-binding protein [Treponemataceae bacterium]|jgi:uncharacterized protein with FMN-binding domain|nr:FMN-binding protein [Treponemataceae bacterium]